MLGRWSTRRNFFQFRRVEQVARLQTSFPQSIPMNTLFKWLNQPVFVTFTTGGSIRGTLVEVDERWLALQLPKDKGLSVLPLYSVQAVSLGKR